MNAPLRVAFFTDSYYEANGVARTSHALEAYAAERARPLLCVHGGSHTRLLNEGSISRLELRRSRLAFALDHDLRFDLLLWRHYRRTAEVVRQFRPDVLHFTGPSDIGQMGALVGHRLGIPMVGSWHTNLHEYASRRMLQRLHWLSEHSRLAVRYAIETYALAATIQFYNIPRILLAPNEDLLDLLSRKTGKPARLMSRGVDAAMFRPSRRDRDDDTLEIGYVGRLSAEKSVRVLADVEAALVATGESNYQFVIVGEGSEKEWLLRHLRRAEFCGVVQGEALARVYANLDLFVLPSETETVGNVVLEAMASGVPIVAMARGGPKFIVNHDISGLLADTERAFIDAVLAVSRDRLLRQRLSTAARMRALELTWDRIFDAVYDVYRETSAMVRTPGADDDPAAVATPSGRNRPS